MHAYSVGYWISIPQLAALGIKEEYIYFAIITIGIVSSYLLINPIINWVVHLQSARLLSYILSSLIIIVLFFIVVLIMGEVHPAMFGLFKFGLQGLASFGIILLLYYSYKRIFGNI
ncbi:hypothetical protein QGM71_21530 [Virgibacillus sp. C22-A2]|uniref:Uncharacterized protein n=1 Tax=Virgibacillus tibetensis TaxID=3042313 RepID=A0ABU6KLI0_9BACI|nr:hypothetical protein [Virgibacillus sp. C22-A2]